MPGVARRQATFFCFAKKKVAKEKATQSATSSKFPALLVWSGFLINSHDPLRGHVLKHIRQKPLTNLHYSVADEGKKSGNSNSKTSNQT
jgi:hypothetical protein